MDTTMKSPIGHEHGCMSSGSVRCRHHQAGKPKTKNCPICGGAWIVHTGYHTVQIYRGDNRYTLETAESLHTFAYQAASRASALNRIDPVYVIRFILAEA